MSYERLFELAVQQAPQNLFSFANEDCVIFKGFKVSRQKDGQYLWRDVRTSDFYDDVDPLVTEKILETGDFVGTLERVQHHDDHEKVAHIKRCIRELQAGIDRRIQLSQQYFDKSQEMLDEASTDVEVSKIKKRLRRYLSVQEKKRNVLRSEIELMQEDLLFIENRISLYNQKFEDNGIEI